MLCFVSYCEEDAGEPLYGSAGPEMCLSASLLVSVGTREGREETLRAPGY